MKRMAIVGAALMACFLAMPAKAVENNAFKYSQMKSTTTVSTTPVFLHAITITDSVAVAFTVYDSTSTDVTSVPIAVFDASAPGGTYLFDTQLQNGLVHIGAANGAQVTISYRH